MLCVCLRGGTCSGESSNWVCVAGVRVVDLKFEFHNNNKQLQSQFGSNLVPNPGDGFPFNNEGQSILHVK